MKFLHTLLFTSISLLFISCGETTIEPISDILKLEIKESKISIYSTDDAKKLTAYAVYADKTKKDITDLVFWSSSDTNVTIVSNGKVYGGHENGGEANITISHLDMKSEPCLVKVIPLDNNSMDINGSIVISYQYDIQIKKLEDNVSDRNATTTFKLLAIGSYGDSNRTIIKNIVWKIDNNAKLSTNDDKNETYIEFEAGDVNITSTLFGDNNSTKSKIILASVADAGIAQNVAASSNVTLDASNSYTLEDGLLSYAWELSSKPKNSKVKLSDKKIVNPSFTADKTGKYVFKLAVKNNELFSLEDKIVVRAYTGNIAPVADAGKTQYIEELSAVTLDGLNSFDAEDENLTYLWKMVSKPKYSNANLIDETLDKPIFCADLNGTYKISLVVNDGEMKSDKAYTTVHSSTAEQSKPVADAGENQVVKVNDSVNLSAKGTDIDPNDKSTLTYYWRATSLPAKSRATLTKVDEQNSSFTADTNGVFVFQLIVNDGSAFDLNSTPDTVMIIVE